MSAEKLQLGIAVRNLEQAVDRAEKLFGIGPFRTIDVPEAGVRAAMADWAGVELEYIEATSVETKKNYEKILDKYAAKLIHIGAYVPDKDQQTEHFKSLGVPVVYDNVGNEELRTSMVDLRQDAGFLLEILQPLTK